MVGKNPRKLIALQAQLRDWPCKLAFDREGPQKPPIQIGDGLSWIGGTGILGCGVRLHRRSRIQAAAEDACNTALIKPNQAGTLSETKAALDASRQSGWEAIVSARSGETEDTTIVHLAVGWGVKQLKVGSFARSERMAKWNEGLRIAESLGPDGGILAPRQSFPWG